MFNNGGNTVGKRKALFVMDDRRQFFVQAVQVDPQSKRDGADGQVPKAGGPPRVGIDGSGKSSAGARLEQ